MSQQFRILMVEDAASDAELMLRELKRAGMRCDAHRVETAVEYRQELEEFRPQVILSDFSMPFFDGMEALAIARRSHPDIPFIFVSGTLGEEYAVRALKNGAKDYVLKGNLLRLPAVVERAIKETEERRARQALEHQLRASEKRYRELFQNNPHPMWVYDIETLRFLAVNDTAVARYGFSRDEFLAMTINDILPEEHHHGPAERVAKHRTKSGELIDVSVASHDIELEDRRARIVVASRP
jgi:PAS domain S-box-containing protein